MANILIVENNPMNFEIAAELLKQVGHEILGAETAQKGIQIAETKIPDMILMDLSLPDIDGLTLTKILKQNSLTKNIPIVAFTALVMQKDKEKAFNAGCSGFISKPININTFSHTINELLADHSQRVQGQIFQSEATFSESTQNGALKTVSLPLKEMERNLDNISKEVFFSEKKNQRRSSAYISKLATCTNNESKDFSFIQSHNILVIDDNPMNTDLLRDLLSQINQNTTAANCGKQALEIVENQEFDLVLLDIMMPEINGFEVLEKLKQNPKTKDVPVIFISALSEIPDIVKGFDHGSYDYIIKPYNIEEVKARIMNILRIKDLQDELKKEKNKLDLIFKFSADALVMLDPDLRIVSCNDRFLEWFKLSKDEAIGKIICNIFNCGQENCSLVSLNQHTQSEKSYATQAPSLTSEKPLQDSCPIINPSLFDKINDKNYIQELTIQSALGNKVIEIKYSKIQDDAEGFVLVLRDVTLNKEIEIQKETFVATLTHDLKTPIRAEIRAMELLLKSHFGNLNHDQTDIIQDTLYSSKFMFSMVDNLLSTYKYDNGKITLKKESVDIHSLIKTCYNEQKHLINDKNIDVTLDFTEDNPLIYADNLEIKRVIMNILANSIAYSLDNGKIIIKTRILDKNLQVSFTDNGRGISDEELTHIFQKYTSYAKKFKQVGTGLGLYLTKQIIEMHGGGIFVESQLNKGSTFTFLIPV